MNKQINNETFNKLFLKARTHKNWQDKVVEDSTLHTLYELVRMGPTAANCQPLRIKFIKSEKAKKRLEPCLMPANVEQSMKAPVTAILAYDKRFYEHLPRLYPHTDARAWYEGNATFAIKTAFLNSGLQGGYFIVAARALGLDAGPMSGFNDKKINSEFFADGRFIATFLCNLGYGDASQLKPRDERFEFHEACAIL